MRRSSTTELKAAIRAVGAATLAGLALGATPANAAPNDGRIGGPPEGPAASTLCPAGSPVTGAEVTTRDIGVNPVVAVATVLCGAGAVPAAMTMGVRSTSDGPTVTALCAAGQVAVGITGREGDFADRLILRCRNAHGTGAVTESSPLGGLGGVPDGPYDCEAGSFLTGLRGTVVFETTVRFLEPGCSVADLPPTVTLTSPAGGSESADATPTYGGAAGDAADDSQTVRVDVYRGLVVSGPALVETLTATRTASVWSVDGQSPLPPGTYTARAARRTSRGTKASASSGPSRSSCRRSVRLLTRIATVSVTRRTIASASPTRGSRTRTAMAWATHAT